MKKVYGVANEKGEIYAVYTSPPSDIDTVELVENYTWQPSDFSDPENRKTYISVKKLSALFAAHCKLTGLKKKELAKICGKNQTTFSRYFGGDTPVPRHVWDKVGEFIKYEQKTFSCLNLTPTPMQRRLPLGHPEGLKRYRFITIDEFGVEYQHEDYFPASPQIGMGIRIGSYVYDKVIKVKEVDF